MDAGVESPLEVLSRAATMIQETQQQEDAAAAAKSQKQLPTTKWKRDRRTRPDYMRKSDPKYPECVDAAEQSSSSTSSSGPTSPTSSVSSVSSVSSTGNGGKTKKLNGVSAEKTSVDAPLDMTTTPKQRGLPPSYSQAISDPSFRSTYTNSSGRSIINGRDELPIGISMCDPIIDEHFRRSLGKDYNTVFNNNNVKDASNPLRTSTKAPIVSATVAPVVEKPKKTSPPPPPLTTPVTSVIEMMDTTGLSVDDHFAKALGDTWHKLNGPKKDSKNDATNNSPNAQVVST